MYSIQRNRDYSNKATVIVDQCFRLFPNIFSIFCSFKCITHPILVNQKSLLKPKTTKRKMSKFKQILSNTGRTLS